MPDYKHGPYSSTQAEENRVAAKSKSAIVYIGTAPVHTLAGGGANVNKPIVINNIAEARQKLGYSDDFASYTLCEAMKVHFAMKGVGPLIFINVLNPATHVKENQGTKSLTPSGGRVIIAGAESIILDTIVVKQGEITKVKGTDYALSYSNEKGTITISEMTSGALGTSALTITYSEIDPELVTDSAAIGATDGLGHNTGIYALKNVYTQTGYIPSFVGAPGFSSHTEFHTALANLTQNISGHWKAYMFSDLPIVNGGQAVTLENAATFKSANGYNHENETVYYPMVKGTDGGKYHLSVLAAANFQSLLSDQDGIPYRTASNTACEIIENIYLGESAGEAVFDDEVINERLNKNGIASAAYVGGRWAIWGAHSANYSQDNITNINVAETNTMMLYYLSNDFQHRHYLDTDKPMTASDVHSIVAEEQARIDALISTKALISGEAHLNTQFDSMSDVIAGDFSFNLNVTTTPLAKSLTATINWTADGYETYFEAFKEAD